MKRFVKNMTSYFTFTKGERLGIIILLFIILLLLILPTIYGKYIHKEVTLDSRVQSLADSFFLSLKDVDLASTAKQARVEREEVAAAKVAEVFPFDPNTATLGDFVRLGFSDKQAKVILRYRSKGGFFATPKDFSKMYVVDSAAYQRLEPYIAIKDRVKTTHLDSSATLVATEVFIPVSINSADTAELTRVNGIGRTFAKRIVAYRNLLGGFYSPTQLTEVYGISMDMVEKMAPQLQIDTILIKKVNLNTVSYDELRKHPYISDYQAKAIIYYRSKVKQINSPNEILKNNLITKEDFYRVRNYLSVD
ncbi:MAG TPA: helix-hairpin-helix domain-containing protein [Tenuifilaceae bacterium]|nr:helix-hairpin-helix domain-containing protein [Tenuifilaceae bacterium]